MDVTNSNFMELLPRIKETVSECDFVAIDTELSGLMRGRNFNIFDLPKDRFAKVVESSKGYFILQFGLSCFRYKSFESTPPLPYKDQVKESQKLDTSVGLPPHSHDKKCSHDIDMLEIQSNDKPSSIYGGDKIKKVTSDDLEEGEINDSSDEEDSPVRKGLKRKVQANNSSYTCQTYNFYIFPQHFTDWPLVDTNRTFSIQAHAIQFLCTHGFDFNKLFKDGVSYLNHNEEKSVRDSIEKDQAAKLKISGVPDFVQNDSRRHVKKVVKQVQDFVQEDPNELKLEILELDSGPTSRRNIIMEALKVQPYSDQIEVKVDFDKERNERFLSVSRVDKEVKLAKGKRNFDQAKGFLHILEYIIHQRKPLVGHNLLLDLIHIINQFIEPVSNMSYKDFKGICHDLFPCIYDTKYIASTSEQESIANHQLQLGGLYKILRREPFPNIEIDSPGQEIVEDQLHQAGYDSYLSGYCFIALCESLVNADSDNKIPDSNVLLPLISNERIKQAFCNKIFFTHSHDLEYFDLEKDETAPNRDHVYYVKFPEEWQNEDLFNLFQKWGGVAVGRIDAVSALCALRNKDKKSAVNNTIKEADPKSNILIRPYSTYLNMIKKKQNQ